MHKPGKQKINSFLTPKQRIVLLLFHIFLGLTITKYLNPLQFYAYGCLIYFSHIIIKRRNRNNIALIFAGYLCALEVYLRMVGTNLPWLFSRYSVVLLLALGFIQTKGSKKLNALYLLYFLMLLPSIMVVGNLPSADPPYQLVLAALTGPLVLAVTTNYCHGRNVSILEFRELLFTIFLGLSPCLTFITKHAASMHSIEFTEQSNLAVSAGFGPNQVSSALGMGLIIFFLGKQFGFTLTFNKYSDWALLLLSFIMGVLTFSRGGIISAIIAIIICFFFSRTKTKQKSRLKNSLRVGFVFLLLISQVFLYINEYTDGALFNRYIQNEDEEASKYFTNRDQIIVSDFQMFYDYIFLGVGPGYSMVYRPDYGLSAGITAHTEFSRLLAEHGVFGLVSLMILCLHPLLYYFKIRSPQNKAIFLLFILYAFLTMGHSSMRLALVGFLYGLSFIRITPLQKEIYPIQKNRPFSTVAGPQHFPNSSTILQRRLH